VVASVTYIVNERAAQRKKVMKAMVGRELPIIHQLMALFGPLKLDPHQALRVHDRRESPFS
jgi:hypothetical protein